MFTTNQDSQDPLIVQFHKLGDT